MSHTYSPADALVDALLEQRAVSRIWKRDISVWGASPDTPDARSISTRLGWLDGAETMAPEVERVVQLGEDAVRRGITGVFLLGMGGSSLCAEVMRSVYGVVAGHPNLFVLDTTDERTILDAAARLDPLRSLFLVASKSGGTVEVAS